MLIMNNYQCDTQEKQLVPLWIGRVAQISIDYWFSSWISSCWVSRVLNRPLDRVDGESAGE